MNNSQEKNEDRHYVKNFKTISNQRNTNEDYEILFQTGKVIFFLILSDGDDELECTLPYTTGENVSYYIARDYFNNRSFKIL